LIFEFSFSKVYFLTALWFPRKLNSSKRSSLRRRDGFFPHYEIFSEHKIKIRGHHHPAFGFHLLFNRTFWDPKKQIQHAKGDGKTRDGFAGKLDFGKPEYGPGKCFSRRVGRGEASGHRQFGKSNGKR